jgi:hypothetical protein
MKQEYEIIQCNVQRDMPARPSDRSSVKTYEAKMHKRSGF